MVDLKAAIHCGGNSHQVVVVRADNEVAAP
jgi:hypothetical protein